MIEREALLRSILAQPDDDTVRLVYADFLEENGEEETAWFIRRQLEPGYVSDWSQGQPRERSGHGFAMTREQQAHRHMFPGVRLVGWDKGSFVCYSAAPATKTVVRIDTLFTRGFVSEIHLPCAAFLEHARAIFAAHPVARVVLPRFRAEIDPPGLIPAWRLYYYEADSDGDHFGSSLGLATREEMVTRLIADVRDIDAELL